jgi:hypothetical protein
VEIRGLGGKHKFLDILGAVFFGVKTRKVMSMKIPKSGHYGSIPTIVSVKILSGWTRKST